MSEQIQPSAAKGRSWSRWLWFGLVASVALNLLVVGAVAGFMVRHGPPGRGLMTGSIFGYVKSLPAERRRELRVATREQRREIRPLRQAVRHARRQALEVLAAEPFDKSAYAAAQKRIFEAKMKLWSAAQPFYVAMATSMTAAERRGFVQWRRSNRSRWGGRRWQDGGKRGSRGGPGIKTPPR